VSNSKANRNGAERLKSPPRDWLFAGLAGGGLILSLYLLIAHQTGEIPGCPAGGGCDLVQQSRWSRLFGIPVAAWGAVFYAVLAMIAAWPRFRARFDSLWVLSGIGLVVSLYLTFVTWRELRTTCPYCLVSLALVGCLSIRAGISATAAYRWWLAALAGLAAILAVAIMHHDFGGYEQAFNGPENRYLRDLAQHLRQSDVKFYGAYWCPHCQHQKALFGPAAEDLPYIECSPHGGPGTPTATDCVAAEVRNYPTWRIRNRPHARMLTIAELAALSGFQPPAAGRPP